MLVCFLAQNFTFNGQYQPLFLYFNLFSSNRKHMFFIKIAGSWI